MASENRTDPTQNEVFKDTASQMDAVAERLIEKQSIDREAATRLAPEAFREALVRYPNDVEGALIFFAYAIGLGIGTPTAEDMARAQEVLRRHGR